MMIDFQAYKKKYAYLLYILIFGIWMLFFDSNSLLSHIKLNREIESLRRQKEFLQKEIVKDRKAIKEISTDEGREKFGRENYYFKKENEDIFIIEYDTIK
ncbi:septum formation initiator [Capnocytophaga sp. oral taxon 863 str. F0517]|nr:septum formation initiator [Capnocytophaga sp. oral taxon 863 str. F0517]